MTGRTLTEIEIALCNTDRFNFVKNIVAFNVNGMGKSLPIHHECDMLVLSKSGYLTEIEIKRSWNDFLAEFRKRHSHKSDLIKYFFYCIPKCLEERVRLELKKREVAYSGIITYNEELRITINDCVEMKPYRKLSMKEQLQVARYGAMRSVMLKKKLLKFEKNENIIRN